MFANRIVYKIGLQAACEENSPVHGVGEVLEAVYKALHSKFETQEGMLRQVHALLLCARHVPWESFAPVVIEADDDDMPIGIDVLHRCSVEADGERVVLQLGRPMLQSGLQLQQAQMLRAELDNGVGDKLLVRALLFEPRLQVPGISAACMHTETFVDSGEGLQPVPSAGRKRFVRAAGLVQVGVLPVSRGAGHGERMSRARSDHRQFLRSIGCGKLYCAKNSKVERVGDGMSWRTRAKVDNGTFEVVSVFVPMSW